MTQAAPIRERLGVAGRTPGHGLTVDRREDIAAGVVQYFGTCSCGRWSDYSLFRRLVSDRYVQHLVEAVLDPEGKHDAIRAKVRALRGPIAPSVAGDPRDPA